MNRTPLTILTLFGGIPGLLDPFLDALERLDKPEGTQFLAVNNSPDPGFEARLRSRGISPESFCARLPPESFPALSRASQILKAEQCARLYESAKPLILGKDLLILEHDVIVRPFTLRLLLETRVNKKADLVSAAVLSRITSQTLAWRVRSPNTDEGFRRVHVSRFAKRVQATGFGCLLLDSALFQRMPLEASRPGRAFWGCDLNAGAWAFQQGLRWFIDGRARCDHRGADGRPAKAGRLEYVRAGSYLDFQNQAFHPDPAVNHG